MDRSFVVSVVDGEAIVTETVPGTPGAIENATGSIGEIIHHASIEEITNQYRADCAALPKPAKPEDFARLFHLARSKMAPEEKRPRRAAAEKARKMFKKQL